MDRWCRSAGVSPATYAASCPTSHGGRPKANQRRECDAKFARALSGAEVVKYLYNVDRPARKNPDLRCGRVGDCNADPAGFWLLPLIDPHRYSGPQIATSKEAIMSKLVWASALLCLATMSVPTVAQQSCEKKCMQRCSQSATGGGTAQSDCMSKCMNQQGKCPD